MTDANIAHIYEALEWLKKQPEKNFVVKISNVPRKCKEEHITTYLKRKIKNLQLVKVILDVDLQSKQTKSVFVTSPDKYSLEKLILIHNTPWILHRIKTMIMGFPYSDESYYDD